MVQFSVAPMMDWTDRHCRYFHRALSNKTVLYTEMVTAEAIIHGNRNKLLGYSSCEHPIVLQLGGSNPDKLAEAVKIAQEYDYNEINLNVGCPSDRVQSGAFGACLMKDSHHVGKIFQAMQSVSSVPITIKCRIGVDDDNPEQVLPEFIKVVSEHGCQKFIIHARKAWLKGLSPKENREIPPLNYSLVYEIKKQFPNLYIGINGGITDLIQTKQHLQHVDEVMIGRTCYHTPELLRSVDQEIFGSQNPIRSYHNIIETMVSYIDIEMTKGSRFNAISRHMIGLFHSMAGGKKWRRTLSEQGNLAQARPELLIEAFNHILQENDLTVL